MPGIVVLPLAGLAKSDRNVLRIAGKHVVIVIVPPITMVLAGTLAGCIGPLIQEVDVAFIALLSFAVVALLWIVTQELLLQATTYLKHLYARKSLLIVARRRHMRTQSTSRCGSSTCGCSLAS